jgi:Tfp pilus assembly protein PilN
MATAQRVRIRKIFNLLRPEAPPPSAWDQVYDWLLGRARLVMIVTQVLVGFVFIAKIAVDIQVKALDEQLEAKQAEVQFTYAQVEPKYLDLQEKSLAYVNLWTKSSDYKDILAEVMDLLDDPNGRYNVSISDKDVVISGFGSRSEISIIEAALKSSASLTRVEVSEIKSSAGELLAGTGDFAIRALIKDDFNREIPQ